MKKIIFIFAVFILMLTSLTACSQQPSLSTTTAAVSQTTTVLPTTTSSPLTVTTTAAVQTSTSPVTVNPTTIPPTTAVQTTLPPATTTPTTVPPTTVVQTTQPATTTPAATTIPPQTTVPVEPVDYNSVKYLDIKTVYLTGNRINASNNQTNRLTVGTVLVYRTDQDRFGKMVVTEYGDYLRFKFATYTSEGAVYKQADIFSTKLTMYCDLDSGALDQENADFQYSSVDSIERYLTPQNEAVFSVYNPADITNGFVRVNSETNQELFVELPHKVTQGAYLTYENYVVSGENITGSFQINAASGDLSDTTWYFQVIAPNGEIERSWKGFSNYMTSLQTELDFTHTVENTGYYQIRMLNFGSSDLRIYIKLRPASWSHETYGTAKSSWKIEK